MRNKFGKVARVFVEVVLTSRGRRLDPYIRKIILTFRLMYQFNCFAHFIPRVEVNQSLQAFHNLTDGFVYSLDNFFRAHITVAFID